MRLVGPIPGPQESVRYFIMKLLLIFFLRRV